MSVALIGSKALTWKKTNQYHKGTQMRPIIEFNEMDTKLKDVALSASIIHNRIKQLEDTLRTIGIEGTHYKEVNNLTFVSWEDSTGEWRLMYGNEEDGWELLVDAPLYFKCHYMSEITLLIDSMLNDAQLNLDSIHKEISE